MSTQQKPLEFIGTDTRYPCADGVVRRRIHFDGAASPLAARAGIDMQTRLLKHYSNSHSYVHNSARISTSAFNWAHAQALKFVGANLGDKQGQYACVFTGAGTTAAINRIARGLSTLRPTRNVVAISSMEHHANDLPHRQFADRCLYLPLTGQDGDLGAIDLQQFDAICKEHQDQLNYVAISSVSNVTGITNPLKEVIEIAHRYDIYVVVDAAQSVAHCQSDLDTLQADFWVFSGHKLYTPTAPGVLIGKRSLLATMHGQDLGGGSVVDVNVYDYELSKDVSTKEESGTPNIVGAVSLGATMSALKDYGWNQIKRNERQLMEALRNGLAGLGSISIYGDKNLPRTAALSFNHEKIEHGLLAAILNDYFAIAVRNDCFCAHPYVSSLLKQELWEIDLSDYSESEHETVVNSRRGMVRASLSIYNSVDEISEFIEALQTIDANIDEYKQNYRLNKDGSFTHREFEIDWQSELEFTY